MKESKKPVSFKLSETTIKELKIISDNEKVSQADVISILVHLYNITGEAKNVKEWFEIARLS